MGGHSRGDWNVSICFLNNREPTTSQERLRDSAGIGSGRRRWASEVPSSKTDGEWSSRKGSSSDREGRAIEGESCDLARLVNVSVVAVAITYSRNSASSDDGLRRSGRLVKVLERNRIKEKRITEGNLLSDGSSER